MYVTPVTFDCFQKSIMFLLLCEVSFKLCQGHARPLPGFLFN